MTSERSAAVTSPASTEQSPGDTTVGAKRKRRWTSPKILIPAIVIVLALLTVAALAFQPWRLILDQTVDEAIPVAAVAVPDAGQGTAATATATGPATLLSGSFISHEHETQGTAKILELADGQRILRLEGFRTSNGPDLKVWLTDSRVIDGTDGWFVFDDGKYVDLGPLKGNVGNQNYVIPSDVDLDQLRSVAIWCDRFNVSFGAAELKS